MIKQLITISVMLWCYVDSFCRGWWNQFHGLALFAKLNLWHQLDLKFRSLFISITSICVIDLLIKFHMCMSNVVFVRNFINMEAMVSYHVLAVHYQLCVVAVYDCISIIMFCMLKLMRHLVYLSTEHSWTSDSFDWEVHKLV